MLDEDEEEPKRHWGIGKILLILIALGLAAGFGYLRFKNQGLAWLNEVKKPTAAAPASTPTDRPAATPASPSITLESQPPAQSAANTPQPMTTSPGSAPTSSAAAPSPSTSTPAPAPDSARTSESSNTADSDKSSPPAEKNSTPKESSDETASPAASKAAESPKPAPRAPAPKPSAATRPASSFDPVTEAQRYLYGRGVAQDCDRGLRLLKPEANKANPKAMVEMGALYSAGLCTPRDLPTAYRWFAVALRKDPENSAIQSDLQKLWGEMTQPERQLAIRLTQ